jgi:uncharacterized membrane protein
MYSYLIVVTFEQEEEASRVYDSLQRMRGSSLLGLNEAAVVTADREGILSVIQNRKLPPAGGGRDDNLANLIINLLFGDPPDEMLQALVREGFDDRFREQVLQAVAGNCSALVILTPRDSQVDRGRLLGILTLFKGRVFETTLPLEVEAALAKGWEA